MSNATPIEVATVRMSARGVTARQARQTFAEEHPEFQVLALKKSKGEWLAFLQKRALGPGKDLDGPPSGPPMGLDEVIKEGPADDAGPSGGIEKVKDLLGQLQDAIDALDEGPSDEDLPDDSLMDVDEDAPPKVPPPMSHLLERPKEEGLTKKKAANEVRQLIKSDPTYRGFKLARIIESKDSYKALLRREA